MPKIKVQADTVYINKNKKSFCLYSLLLLFFFLPYHLLQAEQTQGWKSCSKLNRLKRYILASDCYSQYAKSMDLSKNKTEEHRVRKGYFYREASKNLELAAQVSQRIEDAAYLRAKALEWLHLVLRKKLVPLTRGKRRGRYTRNLASQILKKIHYTPLAIATGERKALIEVHGYHFKEKKDSKFNQSLRPGPYSITVTYPNESPRKRKIFLNPGKSLVLTFIREPKAPVISWVGYLGGGAAVVGGGALLTLGILESREAVRCFEDPACSFPGTKNNQEAYQAAQQNATIWMIAGGVTLAVGVGFLALAGVSHARAIRTDFLQKEKMAYVPNLSVFPQEPLVNVSLP